MSRQPPEGPSDSRNVKGDEGVEIGVHTPATPSHKDPADLPSEGFDRLDREWLLTHIDFTATRIEGWEGLLQLPADQGRCGRHIRRAEKDITLTAARVEGWERLLRLHRDRPRRARRSRPEEDDSC